MMSVGRAEGDSERLNTFAPVEVLRYGSWIAPPMASYPINDVIGYYDQFKIGQVL